MNEPENILSAIPELEQEIPASQFMADSVWVIIAWGFGIALLLACLGVLIWFRMRPKPHPKAQTAADMALAELARIGEAPPSLRECSLLLSLTLRRFLTGQTQDPALFETHEEFSQRLDALSNIPKSCQNDTRRLLETLAEFKYAGEQEQDPIRALTFIEETRSLITRINEAQQQEAAAAAELEKVQKMS